jgi:hypothetical protein
MQVTHPRADDGAVPSRATVDGTDYRIKEGVVDAPEADAQALADAWADRFGADADDLLDDSTETCDAIKNDDEVCGRELPCPYHSDKED